MSTRAKSKVKVKSKSKYKSSKRRNKASHLSFEESNVGLSLSPWYSFSTHIAHASKQFLCLTTWGTCMGGINEQYDDIMDHEAAIPMIKENYDKSLIKWNNKRDKYLKDKREIDRFNKEQQEKFDKYDDELHKYYQQQLQNINNNYYNNYTNDLNNSYDDDDDEDEDDDDDDDDDDDNKNENKYNNINNIIQKQGYKYNVEEQHRCPEYQYIPSKPKQNYQTVVVKSTSNNDEYNDEEQEYSQQSSQQKISNTERYNEENDMEHKGETMEEQQQQQQQQLAPKRRKKKDVIAGKSFGRKLGLFQNAAEIKRRRTIEEQEWKKQHSHSHQNTTDEQRSFKPMDKDGVAYIEQFTYSPAAHGVQPHMPRKLSTRDYSKHMKSMEDKDSIIIDDKQATASVSEKTRLFSMMSAEKSLDD